MTALDRRRSVITLFPGDAEAELARLFNDASEAQRAEESRPRRFGQKSEAAEKALAYDDRLAEIRAAGGRDVTLWAIDFLEWDDLTAEHPPRDGNEDDKQAGVNKKTFARALLECSLIEPEGATDLADRKAKGAAALRELKPSRLHYVKLERAAWAVNVDDDALPNFSLASLLTRLRGDDSEQQPVQE